MIDLHCHSHYSDGLLSPLDLIKKAVENGVKILALTDHDTVEGLESVQKEKTNFPLRLIDGIELSVRWKKYDIHILGLNINTKAASLVELIEKQKNMRLQRALQIAEKLEALGVVSAFEKASKIAGHKHLGRPHFAKVLVEEGRVLNFQAAFKKFLQRGKPAFVHSEWVSVSEAVEAILNADGQAVIAHPLKYALTRTKLRELIAEFKLSGGIGLEVVSGAMSTAQIDDLAALCSNFQMLASTGSDYHGDNISSVALGNQRSLPVNCTPIWNQWTTAC